LFLPRSAAAFALRLLPLWLDAATFGLRLLPLWLDAATFGLRLLSLRLDPAAAFGSLPLLRLGAFAARLLTLLLGAATLGLRRLLLSLTLLLRLLCRLLRRRLLALLLLRPLLLALLLRRLLLLLFPCCRSLSGGRRRRIAARGARRIVAQPPLLAGAKRLELRHAARRPNSVLRLPHRHLAAQISAANVLGTDLDRSRDLRRARQDARAHLEGAYRTSDGGCDDRGRDARIDGEAPAIAQQHGLVHHDGLAQEDRIVAQRQNHPGETRSGNEIADPDENPYIGPLAKLDHYLVGR
jgi:hypothetical protein